MLELFFLILLGYRNMNRAKAKGLHGLTWAIYTGIAYLSAYFIGIFVVFASALRGKLNLPADGNKDQYKEAAHQLTQEFISNPLLLFTVYMCAFGGYLLVRYLIDQKPGKPEEPLHWMDKLNNDNQPH
jgi:hypothetical protein